jgi:hypothetical protein
MSRIEHPHHLARLAGLAGAALALALPVLTWAADDGAPLP